jgi:transcriptional regulator with XRE-family HTH domain
VNERFVLLIQMLGLSRSEFSTRTGISLPVISHIASGRNRLSLDQLIKIEEEFPEISTEWLLHGKGEWQKRDENKKVKAELSLHLKMMEQDVSRLKTDVSKLQERIQETIRSLDT